MPWNIAKEFWPLYDKPAEERPLYPFNAEPSGSVRSEVQRRSRRATFSIQARRAGDLPEQRSGILQGRQSVSALLARDKSAVCDPDQLRLSTVERNGWTARHGNFSTASSRISFSAGSRARVLATCGNRAPAELKTLFLDDATAITRQRIASFTTTR